MNYLLIFLKIIGFLPSIISIVKQIIDLISQIQKPEEQKAMQEKMSNLILHAKLGKQVLPLINNLGDFAKELSEKVQK